MFCLSLDTKKSSCWAVKPQDRAILTALGLEVVTAGADLGASMIYGASHRNQVLQQRILAVQPYWAKLRQLRVSPWHKLLLIKMALLPRALHMSHLTFLGKQWFVTLRTHIMRALRVNRAGANLLVRISLVYGLDFDPSFFDAWNAFKALTFYVQRTPFVSDQWNSFCASPSTKRTYGPFDRFMRLLEQLSWTLTDSDLVTLAPGFCLSLRCTDLSVWRPLLEWFWRQQVAVQVSLRKDYHDLDGINYTASFSPWREHDRAQSELLNCVKDGTFYTGVVKSKFDTAHTAHCSCGLGLDTTEHRALVCPKFQSVRQNFLDMTQMWFYLPDCLTMHGLCPRNPFQIPYWTALSQTAWTPPQWQGGRPSDHLQHLFVDGSCSDPGQPEFALAGWSVVSVELECPVGAGLLPGCVHNSNRSEIWALAMAIQWLLDHHCSGILYTDSQYVADGFNFLCQSFAVPSDWTDRDMWDALLQRLQLHCGTLTLIKVSAHQVPCSADPQCAFETYWNSVADVSAKAARLSSCPAELAQIRRSLLSVHKWQCFWTRRSQAFLLELATFSVQFCSDASVRQPSQLEPEDELISFLTATPNSPNWSELFPLQIRESLLQCPDLVSFGIGIAESFCHWLLHLDRAATYVQPVTAVEFYIGYHIFCGLELPVASRDAHAHPIWLQLDRSAIAELMPRTLKSKVDVLVILFDLILSWFGLTVDRCQISKPHLGIAKTLPGYHLPWPLDVEQKDEESAGNEQTIQKTRDPMIFFCRTSRR
eukprot:s1486_g18.t1